MRSSEQNPSSRHLATSTPWWSPAVPAGVRARLLAARAAVSCAYVWRPLGAAVTVAGLVLVCAGAAYAAGPAQPADLGAVIGSITSWLSNLLLVLAALFLTVGGLRYIWAGGDPSEVAKAKETLKWSAVGLAVGLLAPQLAALVLKLVQV